MPPLTTSARVVKAAQLTGAGVATVRAKVEALEAEALDADAITAAIATDALAALDAALAAADSVALSADVLEAQGLKSDDTATAAKLATAVRRALRLSVLPLGITVLGE